MEKQENAELVTGALSHLSGELGTELHTVTDAHKLQRLVEHLWQIIDHIDTLDDIAKDNDIFYREHVRKWQEKRHEYVKSDGYSLFIVNA